MYLKKFISYTFWQFKVDSYYTECHDLVKDWQELVKYVLYNNIQIIITIL